MRFGAVADHLLSGINLTLPPEPTNNTTTLPGKRAVKPKVYIGAATWGDSNWTGKIYPLRTPSNKFRQLYPLHFNAIELNATHYKIYELDVIRKWNETAKGKDFKFCPKFPQQISHYSGFQNVDQLTFAFLESISSFEENLGPIFIQLSESFSPIHKQVLFEYLNSLPKEMNFFVEMRHPQWFSTKKEKDELFTTLHQLNIGAVITDTPGRRDVAHMHLTIPKLFLRFVCNALHPTSFTRTDEWIQRIQYWLEKGLQEVYVFLHPGNEAAIPELSVYWIKQLNQYCNLQLKPPVLAAQQQLF